MLPTDIYSRRRRGVIPDDVDVEEVAKVCGRLTAVYVDPLGGSDLQWPLVMSASVLMTLHFSRVQ